MPSTTREILTLQFGTYSNYIGTHWWNIQESGFCYEPNEQNSGGAEIDHDVLYREGVNLQRQVTYTPRLLSVDLEGSLKHLPVEGELYGNAIKRQHEREAENEEALKKLKEGVVTVESKSQIELISEPGAARNAFQKDLDNPSVNVEHQQYDLSDTVDSWTDYLYGRYHPRTLNIIKEYKHSNEQESLDTFSNGAGLWKGEQFEDEFADKIRQYVEECDYMQGFQTMLDADNGFGGLAVKCLEHLNDEYAKVNFVVPVYKPRRMQFENADEAMSDSIRVFNSALAFRGLIEHATLYVPMSCSQRAWRHLGSAREFPALAYAPDNLYQTSAILATFLDTISLRYRLKDAPTGYSLSGFCGDMTNYGRKLAAAAMSFPFPLADKQDLIDCLDAYEGSLFTQLTPNCSIGTDYVIQTVSVRGIPLGRLKRPREQMPQAQMRMAAYRCESVSEMFQMYLQCSYHSSMAHVSSVANGMPTRVPYPTEMFKDVLNTQGFLLSQGVKRPTSERVATVPVLACVQSSHELGDTLEVLHREAKRININRLPRFKSAGMEDDEFSETLEALLEFKDNYEDNWDL